jgi:hypothetical protein
MRCCGTRRSSTKPSRCRLKPGCPQGVLLVPISRAVRPLIPGFHMHNVTCSHARTSLLGHSNPMFFPPISDATAEIRTAQYYPHLPRYVDSDVDMQQSDAIMRYLGRKHGARITSSQDPGFCSRQSERFFHSSSTDWQVCWRRRRPKSFEWIKSMRSATMRSFTTRRYPLPHSILDRLRVCAVSGLVL